MTLNAVISDEGIEIKDERDKLVSSYQFKDQRTGVCLFGAYQSYSVHDFDCKVLIVAPDGYAACTDTVCVTAMCTDVQVLRTKGSQSCRFPGFDTGKALDCYGIMDIWKHKTEEGHRLKARNCANCRHFYKAHGRKGGHCGDYDPTAPDANFVDDIIPDDPENRTCVRWKGYNID